MSQNSEQNNDNPVYPLFVSCVLYTSYPCHTYTRSSLEMEVQLFELLWSEVHSASTVAIASPSCTNFSDLTVLLRNLRNAFGRAASEGNQDQVAALPNFVVVMRDLVVMMRSLCIQNPLEEEDEEKYMSLSSRSSSSSLSDEEEFKALSLVVFQCVANYLQGYELSNQVWGKLYQSNVIADMVMISVKCKRRKHLSVVM